MYYIGFCLHRGSYLLWSPVIVAQHRASVPVIALGGEQNSLYSAFEHTHNAAAFSLPTLRLSKQATAVVQSSASFFACLNRNPKSTKQYVPLPTSSDSKRLLRVRLRRWRTSQKSSNHFTSPGNAQKPCANAKRRKNLKIWGSYGDNRLATQTQSLTPKLL